MSIFKLGLLGIRVAAKEDSPAEMLYGQSLTITGKYFSNSSFTNSNIDIDPSVFDRLDHIYETIEISLHPSIV